MVNPLPEYCGLERGWLENHAHEDGKVHRDEGRDARKKRDSGTGVWVHAGELHELLVVKFAGLLLRESPHAVGTALLGRFQHLDVFLDGRLAGEALEWVGDFGPVAEPTRKLLHVVLEPPLVVEVDLNLAVLLL